MFICEQCGRKTKKKIRYGGYTLCSKHMHQLQKYHRFLDDNPRSQHDLNEIRVRGNIAEVDVYDTHGNTVATFIIDAEDVDKIRYHKWRLSYGHIVTGNNTKTHPTTQLSHLLLDEPSTDYHHKIDHINGDALDNRKANLRVCTQGQNVLNKRVVANNTTGVIGVYKDKRKSRKHNYCAEIRINNKKTFIGAYRTIAEAAWARHVAETVLFKEFRNTEHDEEKKRLFDTIDESRKTQIRHYVEQRLS